MAGPGPVSTASDATVVVAGPTAGGKSALALYLAEALDGTVINADSMQVYRELRVLTARPTPADEARVPHRLYGVLSVAERCSAGRWLDLATEAIEEARDAGRLPVVVGGTGMYLQCLTAGLSPVPAIPPAVQTDGETRFDRLGGEAFRQELADMDPDAAARLPASDRQRLVRAWCVVRATGRPLSAWHASGTGGSHAAGRVAAVVVSPPRKSLYATCDSRFERMLADGALDEVRALMSMNLAPGLPAMKALGVPHLIRHLAGDCPYDAAVSAAKQASRNYIKRQLTWLRHHKISKTQIETQFPECEGSKILSFIRQFLLTRPD